MEYNTITKIEKIPDIANIDLTSEDYEKGADWIAKKVENSSQAKAWEAGEIRMHNTLETSDVRDLGKKPITFSINWDAALNLEYGDVVKTLEEGIVGITGMLRRHGIFDDSFQDKFISREEDRQITKCLEAILNLVEENNIDLPPSYPIMEPVRNIIANLRPVYVSKYGKASLEDTEATD